MANTLKLLRNGAVGFIDWLDFGAVLRDEFIIKFALAAYNLPAANWTSFYVTTEDVNLAFPDAAVVTGLPICSPVLFLISIANAVEFLASDAEARLNRVIHHELINLTRIRGTFVNLIRVRSYSVTSAGGTLATTRHSTLRIHRDEVANAARRIPFVSCRSSWR